MPIASGARGMPGILAIPGGAPRIARAGGMLRRPFRSPPLAQTNPVLSGTTLDAADAPLPGCTVRLFRTVDNAFLAETVSDGSGNYQVTAPGSGPFYVVAYLPGSPDVAGTTLNTLSAD